MTVDHLKMLHTAGGKGKVSCLTVGSAEQPCREAAVRGVRTLALGVQCAVGALGESEGKFSYVSSGIWDFLLLDEICGVASTFCSASSRLF